jgi:hypothetical protein
VWCPVSFSSDGGMIVDTSINSILIYCNFTVNRVEIRGYLQGGSSLITVTGNDIWLDEASRWYGETGSVYSVYIPTLS